MIRPGIAAALALLLAADPALAENDYDKGRGFFTGSDYQPILCDPDSFVSGLKCRGGWCESVGLTCRRVFGAGWGPEANFRPFVTSRRGRDECEPGEAVAGIACRGTRCEGVSLLCVPVLGELDTAACALSPVVSEENGEILLGDGAIMTGLVCEGRYCDDKRLVHCPVVKPGG